MSPKLYIEFAIFLNYLALESRRELVDAQPDCGSTCGAEPSFFENKNLIVLPLEMSPSVVDRKKRQTSTFLHLHSTRTRSNLLVCLFSNSHC